MEKIYFYGKEVSDYGVKNGYLDYLTLSKAFNHVFMSGDLLTLYPDFWENVESGNLVTEDGNFKEFYQYYIVDDNGAEILEKAGEVVLYSEELNMYIWCVDHFGTSWDYVLTNVKIPDENHYWFENEND